MSCETPKPQASVELYVIITYDGKDKNIEVINGKLTLKIITLVSLTDFKLIIRYLTYRKV